MVDDRWMVVRLGTIAVSLSFVVGLTAGCNDDGPPRSEDAGDAGGGNTLDPATEDSRTNDERAADRKAAETVVLTLEDLGPGWESSPPSEDDEADRQIKADLAECLEIDPDLLELDEATARSDDFATTDDEDVSASVSFMPSVEAARQTLEVRRHEDMASCFPQAIKANITDLLLNPPGGGAPRDDLEVGEPTFSPIPLADLGDEVVAYRTVIPLSISGRDVELYADFVLVRVGRIGIQASFQSALTPFPTDEAERLLGIMIDRVPDAA